MSQLDINPLLQAIAQIQAQGIDTSGTKISPSVADLLAMVAKPEAAQKLVEMKQGHEAEMQRQKQQGIQEAMRLKQAQTLLIPTEIGNTMMQASQLAQGQLTKTPDLDAAIAKLRSMGEAGAAAAEGVESILRRNLEAATLRHVDTIKGIVKQAGSELDPETQDRMTKNIKAGLELGNPLDLSAIASEHVSASKKTAAERAAHEAKERAVSEAADKVRPQSIWRMIAGPGEGERTQRLEAAHDRGGTTALAEEAARIGKENRRGGLFKGLLGGAAATLILSKMFGSDQASSSQPSIPPEVMMQLASRMRSGGGGGADDEGAGTGRELLNMQRALGVMKAMSQMSAMNGAGAQPTVAQLV